MSLLAAGSANALGVGRPLTQSALGQPLNLLFPIRLNADETLTPDCVRADVTSGDARVPSALVQLMLEGEGDASVRGVRLQSSVSIDEPIVTISLSLGCPTRFTRQYTAFIDPPITRSAAPAVTALTAPVPEGPAAATAPLKEVMQATLVTSASSAAADVAPRNYSPALRAALATADAKPTALLAAGPRVAPASTGPNRPLKPPVAKSPNAPDAPNAPKTPKAPKAKTEPMQRQIARAATIKNKPAPNSMGPRLRLDAPEQVESASLAASAAARSDAVLQPEMLLTLAQLEALGQSLAKVQRDQIDTEKRLLAMRAELAQAQALQAKSERAAAWLQAMWAVAVLGLAGGCAYLWRSRRQERRLRDQQWWASGQGAAATLESAASEPAMLDAAQRPVHRSPSKGPTPGLGPLVPRAAREAIAAPAADILPVQMATAALIDTSPAPFDLDDEGAAFARSFDFVDAGMPTTADPHIVSMASTASAALTSAIPLPKPLSNPLADIDQPDRQVTVEELIDLEQQVDFFVVLGQDDAAIDLLQTRISTGQANALPYLKLLELHQRRGDAIAFSDLAAQFGTRFGALPPTWGLNLNEGRSLESYDRAMQSLASGWDDSGHSMALLQNLLARGTGPGAAGGDGERGFDLPAYRDLLTLYSVARDRAEHELRSDGVDLLLPLDEEGDETSGQLSTMVWRVPPTLVPPRSDELDISLDESPITRP